MNDETGRFDSRTLPNPMVMMNMAKSLLNIIVLINDAR